MVSNVDFAQTLLDLAGLPEPSYMQGRSFAPILAGEVPIDWEQLVYHRYWMNQDVIHNAYAHYGIRTHRYKLIYWYNQDCGEPGAQEGTDEPEWELFDLEKDPMELTNVYHAPEYEDVVRDMTEKLDRKMTEIGDIPVH
jgi:arylsulfatase A-like enzyme